MTKKDPLEGFGWDGVVKIRWVGIEEQAGHANHDVVRERLKLLGLASDSPPGESRFAFSCRLLPAEEGKNYRTYEMKHDVRGFTYRIRVDSDPLENYDLDLRDDDQVLLFCDSVVYDRAKALWREKKIPEVDFLCQYEDGGLHKLA